MNSVSIFQGTRRRETVLFLAFFLVVVIFGMVAFAVDLGSIVFARTQLQVAADSSALAAAATMSLPRVEMEAVAEQYAAKNPIGPQSVVLQSQDIQYGTWDTATRSFTPSPTRGNAVRVTARADDSTTGEVPLFFARIFNKKSASVEATAVVSANPRDICFVIDLSGSMNYDTDLLNAQNLDGTSARRGSPALDADLMNAVYKDFGYGDFPGRSQSIGQPLGVSTLRQLSEKSGPLAKPAIPHRYRIQPSDSPSVRMRKAYSWAMDIQIPALMPSAKPTPNSTKSANFDYWVSYLSDHGSELGYRSYMHFMMYNGRDRKPGGVLYTPLSQYSRDCPFHSELTASGTISFPPREEPLHGVRRAVIAALQLVKERNETISDPDQRDWISIVTFDNFNGGGPVVRLPLCSDYGVAMNACTTLQACSHCGVSTAIESGLITAREHIKPAAEGGLGRPATNKIVVLLSDGKPNLCVSSTGAIAAYCVQYPSGNFYENGGHYPQNAALMQAAMMQREGWFLYPVGIGLEADYDFMDRMARMGETADAQGQSPRSSGNPFGYERRLTEIFEEIITTPKLRLVQ
jgi:hypothetical protein